MSVRSGGINVDFDVRTDTPLKRDPDKYSPTLRRYHHILWSKRLPGGQLFDLDASRPRHYLLHQSALGRFALSSDTVVPTYWRWRTMRLIVADISPDVMAAFRLVNHTIGGMMVFPANKVENKPTINSARGFVPQIADRMDLTLECIRRHYLGKPSPLDDTIGRYRDFFAVFENFAGYVNFFLLQDLVTENHQAVRFFLPFDDFRGRATPKSVNEYEDYRRKSMEFIRARNERIAGTQH